VTTRQLQSLIRVLRANGVTSYSDGALTLKLSPEGPQSAPKESLGHDLDLDGQAVKSYPTDPDEDELDPRFYNPSQQVQQIYRQHLQTKGRAI
jgi:hypothetical protein